MEITNWKLWHTVSRGKIFLCALAGAAVSVGVLFLPLPSAGKYAAELVGCLIMTAMAFPVRRIRASGNVVMLYCKNAILFGGIIWILQRITFRVIPRLSAFQTVLFFGTVIFLLWKQREEAGSRNGEMDIWTAVMCAEHGQAEVKAMIDSGNSLYEPISGQPVCVVDPETARSLWDEEALYRVIPYHCVDSERGIMKGFLLRELRLSGNGPEVIRRNVYIAVSPKRIGEDGQGAKLLLSPKVLEKNEVLPLIQMKKRRGKPARE